MAYTLLTGATGLLGRYLMRDLTLANVPLAVVIRPTRNESVPQRIESALAHWEKELGRALLRPVVLEGNLTEPHLGLSDQAVEWLKSHCKAVVHSAASLTFYGDDPAGEPWRSNTLGTRNVLDLCRIAGVRELHHVSTAYVCGERRGRIFESELNVGQRASNDYERTKLQAEEEVRAAEHIEQLTVHRPSIIVGDSQTGYTSSYHGFYTPLRLIHSLLLTLPWATVEQGDWLGGLQLEGHECKNLVPVDWVSACMTWLITHPETSGQTYHLTNPNPVTVGEMVAVMAGALAEYAQKHQKATTPQPPNDEMIDDFREQMEIYRSYWSDDPAFDSSNMQATAPHLPCPQVDHDLMNRLIQFAIQTNFGWPREPSLAPKIQVASYLAPWLNGGVHQADANGGRPHVNLRVSGGGGGQWRLTLNQNGIVAASEGLQNGDVPTCYLTSETFSHLISGDMTCAQAVRSGRLFIEGTAAEREVTVRVFHDLATQL